MKSFVTAFPARGDERSAGMQEDLVSRNFELFDNYTREEVTVMSVESHAFAVRWKSIRANLELCSQSKISDNSRSRSERKDI